VKYSNGQLTQPLNGGTFNSVKITFDPVKHRAALSERGLNFADASIVFAGPTITVQDTRRDYGETRLQTDFLTAESRWLFGRRVKKPGTLSR
jgi:hypothetical protein